jgi:hypothetical protein
MLQQLMSSLGASKHVLAKLAGGLALFAQSVMSRSSSDVDGAARAAGRAGATAGGRGGEMRRPRGVMGLLGSGTGTGPASDSKSLVRTGTRSDTRSDGRASTAQQSAKGGSLRRPRSAVLDLLRGVRGRGGVAGVGMGSQW